MQYFTEFNNFIDFKIGILKQSKKNEFSTINEEIITDKNRAIIGDEVYYNNGVIMGIKERSNKNIVGILMLDSKIKYGLIKDKSLYLFKPTNKKYPNFYIPYKKSPIQLYKIYCIIKFKEWNITSKLPLGIIEEIIGNVGNKEFEYEHLRNYYNLKNNTWRMNNNFVKDINDDENYKVFSIDPIGSKDIDDAFHFTYNEIGIHIASPYKYFENSLSNILNRVSTIYLPDKKYNMLPNNYADNFISLIEGQKRYALSLIIKFDENYNIISEELKETIVLNIKNYNYEEFTPINEQMMKLFFDISNKILKDFTIIDSHILVEKWMIFTNKRIANILIKRNIGNLIIRTHSNQHSNEQLNKEIDKDLQFFLNIKKEQSALYEIYDKNKNQFHSKLGNEYYTHFTSPIRRAIDFFIHCLIIKNENIFETKELEKIVEHINIFTKNSRKFDRNIKRLNFLFTIKEFDKNIETYAYIINIKQHCLTIYIPEYKLEEKITGMHCYDDYKLYQKINIKLWVFTSFENIFDKLKIEILHP